MKRKILLIVFALMAIVSTSFSAITVRLDPQSCSSWSTVRLYYWGYEAGDLLYGLQWPGIVLSPDADGWYSYTFDSRVAKANIIWTDGVNQTIDITDVSESTCYALNSQSGTKITVSIVNCPTGENSDPLPGEKYKIGNLYYNLDASNHTAEVVGYDSGITFANIPSSVTYGGKTYTVISIRQGAFFLCYELTSVTIPNSVTSIGKEAFSDCYGLTSVTIPNSVTSIGEYAFYACSSLASVTIPNSVTSIGDVAFAGCAMPSVAIPNSVQSIGEAVFAGCSGLTSIVVESGNQNYDSRNNCNAIIETAINTLIAGCKNTIIPNSVTSIGNGAFSDCYGLISITIPNSVTSIGKQAFYWCQGLTSVTIGNSVTSIGKSAFYACRSLASLTIGNSVTSIGEEAFSQCKGLTSITIPNSVTSIEKEAFSECTGLTSVTCLAALCPRMGSDVFRFVDCSKIPLYVPAESVEAYRGAAQWNEFNPILPIGEGIEDIVVDTQKLNKILIDGQVYILRNEKIYSTTGQEVK